MLQFLLWQFLWARVLYVPSAVPFLISDLIVYTLIHACHIRMFLCVSCFILLYSVFNVTNIKLWIYYYFDSICLFVFNFKAGIKNLTHRIVSHDYEIQNKVFNFKLTVFLLLKARWRSDTHVLFDPAHLPNIYFVGYFVSTKYEKPFVWKQSKWFIFSKLIF